jgi:hypothetical protein
MATITNKSGRASTFGILHIDRNVLMTPARTIALSAIATVSVGSHVEHRPRLLLWAAAATLAALSFGATQVGIVAAGSLNLVSISLGLIAAGLAIYALKPDDQTHYLLISTSDGTMTRFAAADRALLDEARRLLTEKMNGGADSATFNINFETGVIDNLAVGRGGATHATASAASANLQGAALAAQAARAAPQLRSPVARGAANGSAQTPNETSYVDFAPLLPAIVEMQRFYARQPNAQHLEHRLSELELLMRSGAQTAGQKTRVRELTNELGQILQAYQPAVQIFQQISGMAA